MSSPTFLAVDLQGKINNVALCSAPEGIDSPGWPVRSSLLSLHCWDKAASAGSKPKVDEVHEILQRWKVSLSETPVAILSEEGREQGCQTWTQAHSTVFPRYRYAISPRGIVMAEQFRDYQQDLPPHAALATDVLKRAFAPLVEQAADDVQSAGFEQDDCIMDRYILLRSPAQPDLAVAIESLTDEEWIHSSIRSACQMAWNESPCDLPSELVRVYLRCAVEPPDVFPAPLPATDGHIERAALPATPEPFGDKPHPEASSCYDRNRLLADDAGRGPATIMENATPIRIPAGQEWHVTRMGHILCGSR